MSNTEEIRELMADRVAWDAKVQRVVEATRQRTVRPPRKTRKGMKARGTGSGRPRKRVISQAARRTRKVNAPKYIDQLHRPATFKLAPTTHPLSTLASRRHS
ncbi:hypothetical protein DIPPA_22918 [Diplonema papillatum]|nr:hypothetical protein DIPPA_22918 [Diplonema papillatum]